MNRLNSHQSTNCFALISIALAHKIRRTLTSRRSTIVLFVICFVATSIQMAFAQVSGTWTATGALNFPRVGQTATLLPNGQVLVAGGEDSNRNLVAAAELYNPATGKWTVTGSLNVPRLLHTATLLTNGEVLIAGGGTASAEIYNPYTGQWTATGNMIEIRSGAGAALLPNGEVLMAGGDAAGTAELYNASTGKWTATTSIPSGLAGLAPATLLFNDKVLLSGNSHFAALYNPSTAQWTSTGSMSNTSQGPAVLLPSGKVLMFGATPVHLVSYAAKFYDPSTNTWQVGPSPGAELISAGSVVLLGTGKVLVVGSESPYAPTTHCALYDPLTNAWKETGARSQAGPQTATLLPNGKVLALGLSDAELYTP